METRESASWDAEYRSGRYEDDPPVGFVQDIVAAARTLRPDAQGLYVGCGNGRNYLPLRAAGLHLIGLDISDVALAALARRSPEDAGHLVHGTVDDLPADRLFDMVVGIQVFQHGDRATAHAHLRAALRRVRVGGLFCLRVNAVGTDVHPAHRITERAPDGGFTVEYLEGAKRGLRIHFFSRPELTELLPPTDFAPLLPPRIHRTHRRPLDRRHTCDGKTGSGGSKR
ncbi:class I SAM-dependent methyltransferase [Streptomyces sp. NPDC046939]|uniref:class I SAM-dependent methyltransferase n=1 Tax=Streptomyces sp. NPDC046939 TaxID=3155376 RepID=UPI003409DC81